VGKIYRPDQVLHIKPNTRFTVDVFPHAADKIQKFVEIVCETSGKYLMPPLYFEPVSDVSELYRRVFAALWPIVLSVK
jgi:hypothetical protein